MDLPLECVSILDSARLGEAGMWVSARLDTSSYPETLFGAVQNPIPAHIFGLRRFIMASSIYIAPTGQYLPTHVIGRELERGLWLVAPPGFNSPEAYLEIWGL